MTGFDVTAEVQRRQQAVIDQAAAYDRTAGPRDGKAAPNPWTHVSLPRLFEEHGNVLQPERRGEIQTSHQPMHSSHSGTCVSIAPKRGVWWCSSCQRGGSAVTFVMDIRGCSYRDAVGWLTARYGPASGQVTARPSRRVTVVRHAR